MEQSVGMTTTSPRSQIAAVLSSYRTAFLAIGLFSGLINILMLTGSLFMLQIYDRVLPSRSVPTLLALAALVVILYLIQGVLEFIRGRVLGRIGTSLDTELGGRAFDGAISLPLKGKASTDGLQPLRDIDQIRGFLSGNGPAALFDLPWMPLYLIICFAFHFWIGITALAGAIILISLTLATEALTRKPSQAAVSSGSDRLMLAEACQRNIEALRAMGMIGRLRTVWQSTSDQHLVAQQRVSDIAGSLGAASRVLRMILQSAVLGVGAYLVIIQEATPGIIIASSILVSRALAPVELAIANWRGFVASRQSAKRLAELISQDQDQSERTNLPDPRESLSVEALSVAPPGQQRLVVQDISFQLKHGQGLGIIGPTASGKSSLARAIVGVWPPTRGQIRIDVAGLDQWAPESLGRHIGYLPQDVELFEGTVAENICRFAPDANGESIIKAAREADVHELVLRLPAGYDTRIGEAGRGLSAGQRQRIALARALYGEPFLIVLDEPNSNLDSEGEEALAQGMLSARARGAIVIVIAHRPSALRAVDHVLAIANGKLQAFGPKDDVLRKVLQPPGSPLQATKTMANEGA